MGKKIDMKQVRDSVHGYIDIPEIVLHEIIDTPIFQRLRQIEQTSMRTLYPCAHHDRFAHSLGVYHLGQLACQGLEQSIKNLPLYSDHEAFWKEYGYSFQLACLLHDCAHAPMSHSFEYGYLDAENEKDVKAKKERLFTSMTLNLPEDAAIPLEKDVERYFASPKDIAPHEMVSAIVAGEYYREPVKHALEVLWSRTLAPEELAEHIQFMQRCIIGLQYGDMLDDNPEISFQNCLISLLNGSFFDVDKLDYIVRDSVQSGANNLSIDIPRILKALTLVEVHTFSEEKNVKNLVLNNSVYFTGCKSAMDDIAESDDCECSLELMDVRLVGQLQGDLEFKGSIYLKTPDGASERQNGTQKFTDLTEIEARLSSKSIVKGRFKGNIEVMGYSDESTIDGIVHSKISGTIKGTVIGHIETDAEHHVSYEIGYAKSALSVIQDTVTARNRLYLWTYAHHKVVYNDYLLRNSVLRALLTKKTQALNELEKKEASQKRLRFLMDIDKVFFDRKDPDSYLLSDGDLIHLMKQSAIKGNPVNTLAVNWFARKHMYAVWKSYAEYNSFFMNLGVGRRKDLWSLLFSGRGDSDSVAREANTDEYPDSVLREFTGANSCSYMWIKPAGIKLKETDASKVYIVLSDDSVKRLKDVRSQEGISEQYADESFFYLYTSEKLLPEQKAQLISFLKSRVMKMCRT